LRVGQSRENHFRGGLEKICGRLCPKGAVADRSHRFAGAMKFRNSTNRKSMKDITDISRNICGKLFFGSLSLAAILAVGCMHSKSTATAANTPAPAATPAAPVASKPPAEVVIPPAPPAAPAVAPAAPAPE